MEYKIKKRVWFEVELQGAQGDREAEVFQVSNDDAAVAQRRLEDKQLEEKTNTDCLVKEQEKVHLGIKVGANITVTGVPGQEGAKGNVAEKKKVKESMKANLGKLLKYNAWSTSFQGLLGYLFNNDEGKLYDTVFQATKKQMDPKSLTTFQNITYQCVHEERATRPTANDVLIQLRIALKYQEDLEVWEPRMPRDYKQIIQMIDSNEINFAMSYENIHTSLRRGSLLRRNNKVVMV
ncbi:hypothetical protein Tco_1287373 [Tanacetum coccineum]